MFLIRECSAAKEGSHFTSEIRTFEALCAKLEVLQRRLADRDGEIDTLRTFLTTARNAIDNDPAGPSDQV